MGLSLMEEHCSLIQDRNRRTVHHEESLSESESIVSKREIGLKGRNPKVKLFAQLISCKSKFNDLKNGTFQTKIFQKL